MDTSISNVLAILLNENNLSQDPTSFTPRIIHTGRISDSQISNYASETSLIGKTSEEINVVDVGLNQSVVELVCAGKTVTNSLGTFYLSAKGAMKGEGASFSNENNSCHVVFIPSKQFRDAIKEITFEVKGYNKYGPIINEVYDKATKTKDTYATSGKIMQLSGSGIKVVGTNEDVGIYFKNITSGTSTKVDSDDIAENYPQCVTFIVPELEASQYLIEIRSQSATSGNKMLKNTRSYEYALPLEVVGENEVVQDDVATTSDEQ